MRQDPSMWNNETNRYEYLGVWKYRIEKESMVESNGWIEFIRRYAVCVRIVLSVREIATTRIGSKYVTSGRKRGSSSLQTIALESVCLTRNRSSAASESKAQKGNGRDGRDYRGKGRETPRNRRLSAGHGIDLNERVSIANECKELRFGTFFFFFFLPAEFL